MLFIAERYRPESFDRWRLAFREGESVVIVTVEWLSLTIVSVFDSLNSSLYFPGNTCFQSFFMSTIIQPLAAAWSRALSSTPT